MINKFKNYLEKEGKSKNTIDSYIRNIKEYTKWIKDTYNCELDKIYRENFLDYKSYLKNIKKTKNGSNLNPKTINQKIDSLQKFNEYLVDEKLMDHLVITKKDKIKIQSQLASPAQIDKLEVESFRQSILQSGSKKNYAVATILAYAGLRISECLNIKLSDYNLITRELIVRSGKGEKHRTVFINEKIVNAIKEYLKERDTYTHKDSEYLFVSKYGNKIDRTYFNHEFKKYSDKITPHELRHFYCSNALESGFTIHEVANQAGHSNIHTTMIYTNPSTEEMKRKTNLL